MKQITKYVCEHCSREYRREKNAEKHESICWKNKENRTCLTCKYYGGVESVEYNEEYIECTNPNPQCEGSEDRKPIVKCEFWEEDTRTKKERKADFIESLNF